MIKKWSRTDNAYRYFCSASSQGHVDDRANCPGGSFSWQAPKVDTLTWRWLITNVKHPELLHERFQEIVSLAKATQKRATDLGPAPTPISGRGVTRYSAFVKENPYHLLGKCTKVFHPTRRPRERTHPDLNWMNFCHFT
jgi:hypothetical protein